MKNVVLYIAMSLDGYIADSKGSVDWIKGQSDSSEMPDTYSPFFKNIDTVILGKRTYDQIITELSPDEWSHNIRFHTQHVNDRHKGHQIHKC
jgi:dihydrofolate reductase